MPDVGEAILEDLIYKQWDKLDTRQRNKNLPEDI